MMGQKKIERRPLLREAHSRKSGHTCTICGAVFGLRAGLAEHREVHIYDRKSGPSRRGNSGMTRNKGSPKLVEKADIFSDKSTLLAKDDVKHEKTICKNKLAEQNGSSCIAINSKKRLLAEMISKSCHKLTYSSKAEHDFGLHSEVGKTDMILDTECIQCFQCDSRMDSAVLVKEQSPDQGDILLVRGQSPDQVDMLLAKEKSPDQGDMLLVKEQSCDQDCYHQELSSSMSEHFISETSLQTSFMVNSKMLDANEEVVLTEIKTETEHGDGIGPQYCHLSAPVPKFFAVKERQSITQLELSNTRNEKRVVNLASILKPRPKSAHIKRVGIVQLPTGNSSSSADVVLVRNSNANGQCNLFSQRLMKSLLTNGSVTIVNGLCKLKHEDPSFVKTFTGKNESDHVKKEMLNLDSDVNQNGVAEALLATADTERDRSSEEESSNLQLLEKNPLTENMQSLTENSKNTVSELSNSDYRCSLCGEDLIDDIELDAHRKAKHLCLICNQEFKQMSTLQKHVHASHRSHRSHKCSKCDKSFPYLYSLKEHLLVHSKDGLEKVHTCEVCGKTFTRASGLRKHTKEEHLAVKPYVCVHCQKSFAYLCSLRTHLQSHSVERPFKCDDCGQSFKQGSNLNKHIRLHHRPKCSDCGDSNCICGRNVSATLPGKTAVCEVCGRACEGQKQLTIHMRVHTGEKPEVCDVCGKSFQHKSNLQKHQMKHSGTKPYTCSFCDRAFYANHSLLSHMRLHTGESPFHCGTCGKRFCTKNSLQVHVLLHFNVRPFACSLCNKTFTQLGNLNKHMALHTGERPFVCVVCEKGFVDSSALRRHSAKHGRKNRLPCQDGENQLEHPSALQSHDIEREKKDAKVRQCFSCPVCAKCFLNRQNYARHVRRHGTKTTNVGGKPILNSGEHVVYLTQ